MHVVRHRPRVESGPIRILQDCQSGGNGIATPVPAEVRPASMHRGSGRQAPRSVRAREEGGELPAESLHAEPFRLRLADIHIPGRLFARMDSLDQRLR